jgi:hypothetical protein
LLSVDEATALRLSQGQRVILDSATNIVPTGGLALAQSTNGAALGIVRRLESHATTQLWKAEKWLAIVEYPNQTV